MEKRLPKASAGHEPNWIDTATHRKWFAILYFDGPKQPPLKKWRLPDIEALATSAR